MKIVINLSELFQLLNSIIPFMLQNCITRVVNIQIILSDTPFEQISIRTNNSRPGCEHDVK